jgi:hypothetical protein
MTTSSVVLPALPFQNQVNINTWKNCKDTKQRCNLSPTWLKRTNLAPGCLSRIRFFSIPNPGSIQGWQDPESRTSIRIKDCFSQCFGSALVLLRIRIRIWIQAFDDQKLENFYNWKKNFVFIWWKIAPWPLKREHSTLQTWNVITFFYIMWGLFPLLDPDPDPADQNQSKSGYGSGSEKLV